LPMTVPDAGTVIDPCMLRDLNDISGSVDNSQPGATVTFSRGIRFSTQLESRKETVEGMTISARREYGSFSQRQLQH
jgi:hypothetical protein